MKHNSATSSLNILLISFLAVLAIWRAIEFKDKRSSPKKHDDKLCICQINLLIWTKK